MLLMLLLMFIVFILFLPLPVSIQIDLAHLTLLTYLFSPMFVFSMYRDINEIEI